MGREGDSTDEEPAKGIAVCEDCEAVVSVWVRSDGTIEPISPRGVCACADPSLRLVDEDELDIDDATTDE